MGGELEQIFLQKRNKDCQQVPEKVLHIANDHYLLIFLKDYYSVEK